MAPRASPAQTRAPTRALSPCRAWSSDDFADRTWLVRGRMRRAARWSAPPCRASVQRRAPPPLPWCAGAVRPVPCAPARAVGMGARVRDGRGCGRGVARRGAVRWDERGTHAPAHALASLGRLPPPPSACVQQKWTMCGSCDLMREGRCGAAGGMRGRRGRSGGPQQSCAAARTAPPRLRRLQQRERAPGRSRGHGSDAHTEMLVNAASWTKADRTGVSACPSRPLVTPTPPRPASPTPALLCAPPRPARLAHLRGDRFCTPIRATPKLPKRQYLLGGS